ncbi:hypothetical protein ACFU5O_03520 [Streptomyces sp. NPDC057445]
MQAHHAGDASVVADDHGEGRKLPRAVGLRLVQSGLRLPDAIVAGTEGLR